MLLILPASGRHLAELPSRAPGWPRNMEHLQDEAASAPAPGRARPAAPWSRQPLPLRSPGPGRLCLRFYGQVLVGNWQELSFIR